MEQVMVTLDMELPNRLYKERWYPRHKIRMKLLVAVSNHKVTLRLMSKDVLSVIDWVILLLIFQI